MAPQGFQQPIHGGRIHLVVKGCIGPDDLTPVIRSHLESFERVFLALPDGIQAEVERQVSITIRGADKALVGQTAAKIRELRKPDPYKGKGIKYSDEQIRRKVGKKAGAK